MFNATIADSYEPQHKLFKRLISLAFTLAGIFWLVMYGFEWAGWLDHEHVQTVRAGQSIIYFILLTLWGIEYLRETKRLKAVMIAADEQRLPPHQITADAVIADGPKFGVLRPVDFGKPSWVLPTVNLAGLVISYLLILNQYARLFFRATGLE